MTTNTNIGEGYKFSSLQKEEIREIIYRYCVSELQINDFITTFEIGMHVYVDELNGHHKGKKELIKQVEDLEKTLLKLSKQFSELDGLNDIIINKYYLANTSESLCETGYEWSDLLSLKICNIGQACSEYLVEKPILKVALSKPEGEIVGAIESASLFCCPQIKIKDGTNSTAVKLVQIIKDEFNFKRTAQRVVSQYIKLVKVDNNENLKLTSNISEKKYVKFEGFKKVQNNFLFKPIKK